MFATLYLPDFFLQAVLRHQSELIDKPVALLSTEEENGGRRVFTDAKSGARPLFTAGNESSESNAGKGA